MCGEKRAAAQFADIIKSDIALWAKVVKDAGIPADDPGRLTAALVKRPARCPSALGQVPLGRIP